MTSIYKMKKHELQLECEKHNLEYDNKTVAELRTMLKSYGGTEGTPTPPSVSNDTFGTPKKSSK